MRYLQAILFALLTLTAHAQTDSVRTEYKTEDESISKSEVKRFIRYITRASVEEKTLVKVGIWPMASNTNRSYRPLFNAGANAETSIERKISPALSVYAGINYSLHYAQYERVRFTGPINGLSESYDRQRQFTMTPKIGARYYYAMAKRVRESQAANNFSGNYISFQAERYLVDKQRTSYYDLVTGDSRLGLSSYVNKRPILSVAWGFQRRLGRLGYVDLSAGPSFRPVRQQFAGSNFVRQSSTGRSLSLQINALIGLGW